MYRHPRLWYIRHMQNSDLKRLLDALVPLRAACPDPSCADSVLDDHRLTIEAEFFRTAHELVPLLAPEFERIALQVAEVQAQNALLTALAGYGESLADEKCSFIGSDDGSSEEVECGAPATQLLIDQATGLRSPVCDQHYDCAPENLKVRTLS